jgi:hypothetical protein
VQYRCTRRHVFLVEFVVAELIARLGYLAGR